MGGSPQGNNDQRIMTINQLNELDLNFLENVAKKENNNNDIYQCIKQLRGPTSEIIVFSTAPSKLYLVSNINIIVFPSRSSH